MNPTAQNDTPGCMEVQSGARRAAVCHGSSDSPIVPPAARRFPPADTCAGQLLAELLLCVPVTPRTFDQIASSMRAAAYVARLRRWGWPIATSLVSVRNRYEWVRYAVYQLEDGVEVGEREQAHIDACLAVRGGGV